MYGERVLIVVGLSVVMGYGLVWGTFATTEAIGIPGVAVLLGVLVLLSVLVAGLVLARLPRTRLFGLACLFAVALNLIFYLMALVTVGQIGP